jgi:xylulose-5-phosphate/fructose-6-phosphate phosphoketolase
VVATSGAISSNELQLVGDVIDRVPQLSSRAAYAKQALRDALLEHEQYIARHGDACPDPRLALGRREAGSAPRHTKGGVQLAHA